MLIFSLCTMFVHQQFAIFVHIMFSVHSTVDSCTTYVCTLVYANMSCTSLVSFFICNHVFVHFVGTLFALQFFNPAIYLCSALSALFKVYTLQCTFSMCMLLSLPMYFIQCIFFFLIMHLSHAISQACKLLQYAILLHALLSLSLMHTLVHKLCPHNTPFMTFPLRYSMHIIPLSMLDLTPFNVHYTLFSVWSSSLQCTITHIIIASQCTIFTHTFSFISDVQSCVHLYSSMHISQATLFFNVHTQVHNPLCYAIVHLFLCAHSMHNPLQWVIHLHMFFHPFSCPHSGAQPLCT